MQSIHTSIAKRYGVAIISIATAVAGRLLLDPLLGAGFPFAMFYFPILLTAWYGGFRPALLAVVLGGIAAEYFLLAPHGRFGLVGSEQWLGMTLYVATGLGIALLGGLMHSAQQRAEERAAERTADLVNSRNSIQESETRLAGIVGSAMDAIISVDTAQRVVLFNAAAEKMFRCPAAQTMGQPIDRLIPGRFRELHRQHIAGFGKTGGTSRSMRSLGALSGLRADGEEFPIEASISQADVGGQKIFTVILRDITERQRAEAAATLLSAIVESSNDAIIGKDLQSVVTSWNAGAQAMFGYTASEMIGQSITRLIPPDRLDDEEKILARIKRGERIEHFETVRQRKDGRMIEVSVTISPIRDAAGHVVGASKVARDITERKRSEQVMRESDERLRMVTENARVGLVMVDRERRYTFANAAYTEMLGLPPQVLAGQRVADVLAPLFETQIRPRLDRAFAGERVAYELHKPLPDGDRYYAVRYEPVKENGPVSLVIVVITDITDRKRAEEALRESEERLQAVMENLTEGLIISDIDGRLLHWNRAGLEMHSFRSLEEGRRKLPEFVDTFELSTLEGVILSVDRWPLATVLSGNRLRDLEIRVRRRDMNWERIFSYSGEIVHDASGKPLAFLAINDLTARKHAEEARRQSDARYRTLFDYAPDGILIADSESNYTDANARICAMLGYAREELVRLHARDIVVQEELPHIDAALSVIKARSDYHREWKFRRKDGSVFDAEVIATMMPDGNLMGMIRDITERKQAEHALLESQEQFRTMVDAMSQLAWMAQPDGFLYWYNQRWYEFTGTTPEQMEGWGWQRVHDPEMLPKVLEEWKASIATAQPFEMNFPLRAANGKFHWFLTRASPLKDSAGRVVRWLGTNTDVSRMREVEEEIQRLNTELEKRVIERTAQLEAVNRELEAFSYSVSHDLRAPLRAVDGFSRAVLEDYGPHLPGEGREYLQDIRRGAQQMGNLIDDLLTFSRLSRAPLKKETVDSGRVVREALDDLREQRKGRKIGLCIGALPPCQGDPALLKQVWINLLSNAIKYTGKREGAEVEIGCVLQQGKHTYFVRDNGTGFDMRYANKLFGVFQRLHRAEEYEGTGVGLAIVQRIVARHGGRVWAEAVVDQGACFYFTLEGGSAS